jgi:uncharacterized RDD family membrane protein YckC
MMSVHASESDLTDWGSLRYAPRERRAPGGARYAPWWQRVSAFLIDTSAVLTAIGTVAIPVAVLAGFRYKHPSDTAKTWLTILIFASTLVLGAVYGIVLEGRSGQTWGKRAVGLTVLAEDGSPCGYGRAASRELIGRILIGGFAWLIVLPGLLSYLAALWDPQRQTWHDRIGQTIVVRVEHPDPGGEPLAPPAPPLAPAAPEPAPAVDVPPRAPEQWRGFGRR